MKMQLLTALASVPDPSPVQPPGADGLNLVLNWVLWIALALGVLAFIVAGVMMMLASQGRMQSGGQHTATLGWVAAGLIVISAAPLLVRTFI